MEVILHFIRVPLRFFSSGSRVRTEIRTKDTEQIRSEPRKGRKRLQLVRDHTRRFTIRL